MSLEPGTQFAGYTIVRKIGAGGMGEVFLAQHPRLPRCDVIKVLAEHVSTDPTFRARFTREADLAAQLDHPCIVSVYDRGEVDGRLWISMQYVAGTDAAALVAANEGGLPLSDVGAVSDSIGAALDHAHRHGLLHRDVKPANILLSAEGTDDPGTDERRIRLADFGIARQTDGGTSLTSANLLIGSFPYSSPEQLSAESLDPRSDVYSLACSVFELLTGTVPFTARSAAMLIHHHLSTPPPEVSSLRTGLPQAVSDAVRHGLAKNPGDRPPSAGAFAAELRSAIDTTGFFPAPPRATGYPGTGSRQPGSHQPGFQQPGAQRPDSQRPGDPLPTDRTMRVRAASNTTEVSPQPVPLPPPAAASGLAATVHAPTEALPTAERRPRPPATGPDPDGRTHLEHRRPASSHGHGFPAATAYSELPGQTVEGPDAHSATIASRDHHVLDPPPTGATAARRTTASLACGIAAVPMSVAGGLGLPLGVAGWYLAGRGPASSAARLAQVLCVLGMILSVGFIGFTVVRAIVLQF
ncbi:protein kinase [Gordonia jinghuaiqii]|uniref:non-specific serine/threonine protein kinase n=1 Tax=Gordonia jinghuaiqii TaxID=2758710 RepID=A0A7D7R9Q9_9ACTN|nr:serine/threonine-protein kinase [Gordonia jinghuaiqii]MCR5979129.1 protein kinase [Gordonia jinghuaiqii]QMT00930.1 protein kinase [Gordonia jinghuaiqii]